MAKKILIIEDDTFLLGLEAKKLTSKGYDILTAVNSVEAFKIMEKEKQVDLILLDLMLPDVDGFAILKKIREDGHMKNVPVVNVPVIVFSNLYEQDDIKKASKLGISEFMIKSNFTLDELAKKIETIIGK